VRDVAALATEPALYRLLRRYARPALAEGMRAAFFPAQLRALR